jgi:hypothetical protein
LEDKMRKVMSKVAVAAVAALPLCAALLASSEPASAQFRHGGFGGGFGGFHGGMSGFHGGMGSFGGWHGNVGGWGGGWRTAGWGGGWHRGWGWRGGWGGCRWGGCGWGGGWWWPAGLATGVALASYPYWGGDYGYGYGYDSGCVQAVPVYSRHGVYLGRRWVNVCY